MAIVRRGESVIAECLEVSVLGIFGDAPLRRSLPLFLVIQGSYQHDLTSSMDSFAVRPTIPANWPPDNLLHQ